MLKNNKRLRQWIAVSVGTACSASLHAAVATLPGLQIDPLWTYSAGAEGGAEIVAADPISGRVFVTNNAAAGAIDVLSWSTGAFLGSIDVGGAPNSVAVKNGKVAVAVEAPTVTDPGSVVMFEANTSLAAPVTHSVTVGALPDMLTFTPDGSRVVVANEGEPDNGVNPDGSVSIIDITGGLGSASVSHASFTSFNGTELTLKAEGVRLFDGISAAADLEPEYVAVSPDGNTAYVSLQEANALAIVDLTNQNVTEIVPLGLKDHSVPGQGIDASDKDGVNQVNVFERVFGMYMPDAIDAYAVGGQTYLVTANEGDARNEDERIKDLTLDPTLFPDASIQDDDQLGRLEVSTVDGDIDGDGDYDQLHAYGARSFSIWDSTGNLVWDSGDMIEQTLISQYPSLWAAGREDNKGPEPESVELLELSGRWLAFVGLERANAVMVFDITDPTDAFFLDLITQSGDISPEGLLAIGPTESGDGWAYLLVANEVSGTTSAYRVSAVPLPAGAPLLLSALAAFGWMRRRNT